ncbi:MAG: polysaccharide deacetylase family protein [Lentisphaeria bacterium]|nr:polysaccharide deacetylase family protein [Lentisphaeria bacterium]
MKVKVAQCWDDGVATDIRLTEIFRKYHAKATFNLCPGTMAEDTVQPFWLDPTNSEWSYRGFRGGKVGKRDLKTIYGGFQVASHCWMHENASLIPDADFLKAAMDARNFLEDIFQQECRGFAWPCGRHTPETERLLAEAGFRYGRTVENTSDVTLCDNPLALASNCHFLDSNFWRKFQEAKKTGVFYFWGHSYEMMEYDKLWERFEQVIKLISEDPDVEWVDVIDLVPLCRGKAK